MYKKGSWIKTIHHLYLKIALLKIKIDLRVMTDRHGYDQNQITIGYDEMIKGAYKHPTIYKICIF